MNRTAKSQYIRGTMLFFPFTAIRGVRGKSIPEHRNLQILKTTEINNFECLAGKKVRHTFQSTGSATTRNHCHLPQSLSPRVLTPSGFVVLCRCTVEQPIDQAID